MNYIQAQESESKRRAVRFDTIDLAESFVYDANDGVNKLVAGPADGLSIEEAAHVYHRVIAVRRALKSLSETLSHLRPLA